ncbi:MAG: DUF1642 domain-containing protein [Staphylococcus equorum]|nr:DUF1642 domain-containing protein [Staphylococcus equorum]
MNRDSLPNEILYLPPIARIHLNGDEYVKYNAVLDKVDNAYELQKPEIPKKLAEMIEELKEAGFSDEYIIFNIYADKEDGVMDNDVERWIGKNEGYFIKAVTNGYTIEKFIVKAPYDRYFGGFLEKGQHAEINFSHINRDNAQKFEDKSKAVAVATLVDGTVEEWSE